MLKTNVEIKRYDLENGFIVDVEKSDEWADFWLNHKDYGIKQFMFELYNCDESEYESIIEFNVDEFINIYKKDYFDEI